MHHILLLPSSEKFPARFLGFSVLVTEEPHHLMGSELETAKIDVQQGTRILYMLSVDVDTGCFCGATPIYEIRLPTESPTREALHVWTLVMSWRQTHAPAAADGGRSSMTLVTTGRRTGDSFFGSNLQFRSILARPDVLRPWRFRGASLGSQANENHIRASVYCGPVGLSPSWSKMNPSDAVLGDKF
jgi:hypothetical protein